MFKKFSKKYFFLLSSLVVLFFLSIPVAQPAQAGLDTFILNLIGTLAPTLAGGLSLSISAILHLFLALSWAALTLVSGIMEWTLSGPFAYSLTNPASNPVINAGWTLLRDLTNMGFVVGLAYIGLATALNIGGFQTKKTFGRFIVAALLINFTPVICGVIVDASNILMTFFTKTVGSNFNQFATLYGGGQTSISILENVLKNTFTTVGLIKILLALILNTVTAIVLFVFSFLFLARNVAIWILVIVSPIAFFCWVFDSTRSTFNKWWSQFLHWSFIGVLAGFALYLSAFLLNAFKKTGLSTNTSFIPDEGQLAFVELAPFVIVLIFMSFAFTQVMKSSASGGSTAINAAKWSGKQLGSAGKSVGLKALKGARNAGIKAEEKLGQSQSRTGKAIGGAVSLLTGRGGKEESRSGLSKFILSAAGVGGGSAVARALRLAGAKTAEADSEAIEKSGKKAGKSMESFEAALKNAITLTDKIGILKQGMKDGRYKFSDTAKGMFPAIMTQAIKSNPLEAFNMRNMDPILSDKLAQELGKSGKVSEANLKKAGLYMSKEDIEKYGTLDKKLFSTAKPPDMENWSKETAQTYMSSFAHEVGTGTHVQKIGEVFGRELIDQFMQGIKTPEEYMKNGNIALGKWIMSGSAANMGISYEDNDDAKKKFANYFKKVNPEEIEKLNQQAQQKEAAVTQKDQEIQNLQQRKATVDLDIQTIDRVTHYKEYQRLQDESIEIDKQIADSSNQRVELQTHLTEAQKSTQKKEAEALEVEERIKEKEERIKTPVSEEDAKEAMLKYRTEGQLKGEAQKAKESVAIEGQKVKILGDIKSGIKGGGEKTAAAIERLGEDIKKAEDKKTKAQTKADFYGPVSGMATGQKQAKANEAEEKGLRTFWNRPKYPETTLKKEAAKDKKITRQAIKEVKRVEKEKEDTDQQGSPNNTP